MHPACRMSLPCSGMAPMRCAVLRPRSADMEGPKAQQDLKQHLSQQRVDPELARTIELQVNLLATIFARLALLGAFSHPGVALLLMAVLVMMTTMVTIIGVRRVRGREQRRPDQSRPQWRGPRRAPTARTLRRSTSRPMKGDGTSGACSGDGHRGQTWPTCGSLTFGAPSKESTWPSAWRRWRSSVSATSGSTRRLALPGGSGTMMPETVLIMLLHCRG